jgi:hypothetical protein
MGVSLEWAHLPSGVYLKTICRNGIPLPDVTHYLLVLSASPVGSVRTPRVYAHLLLPFHIWLDYNGIRLPDVSINDLMRFKQDLRSPACKGMGLLRKGAETADSTLVQTVNSTVRFLQWALGPQGSTPLRNWHEGNIPSQVSFTSDLINPAAAK